MTVEQLALQAIQANAAQGAAVLASLGAETAPATKVAPAPVVVEEPVANPEADLKNDLEAIKKVIKR